MAAGLNRKSFWWS